MASKALTNGRDGRGASEQAGLCVGVFLGAGSLDEKNNL